MLVARNCITFWVPSCICFVTLIDAFFYIKAHVVKTTLNICHKACPTIREDVLAGITAACKKLLYTNDHPHLAVFCEHPESAASPPSDHLGSTTSPLGLQDRHAATIENGSCVCMNGPLILKLQEQHAVWLKEDTRGMYTASCIVVCHYFKLNFSLHLQLLLLLLPIRMNHLQLLPTPQNVHALVSNQDEYTCRIGLDVIRVILKFRFPTHPCQVGCAANCQWREDQDH